MPFRPGMTYSPESFLWTKNGAYFNEEQVLITKDGFELLSRTSTEFYEIH